MQPESGEIIYRVAALLMVGMGVVAYAARNPKVAGKQAALWVVIIAVVTLFMTYWDDIKNSKFASSLIPGKPQMATDGTLTYTRANDGHFYIEAKLNGNAITFMVDTGASDVVLSHSDAKKVGIDVENLTYDRVFSTANGRTRGASEVISLFEVGNITRHDVTVSVNEGEMDGSLLGMRFLDSLSSYQFQGNNLLLTP